MAENITSLELNGIKYALGKSIYAELDLSLERFVELLGRDFYCPTLNSAPTYSTKTYQDTDDSVNTFQVGQPCRWKESDGTYRLAVLADMTSSSATWYKLPVKVSELNNDAGYLTQHQDISGKLDKDKAALTYLGKTDKAASAVISDSAIKAEQDANGNVISSTYATGTELESYKKDVNSNLEEIRKIAEESVETSSEAERVSYNAVNTATQAESKAETAKNAVATLSELSNTTTAQQTLAAQIVQIEENKQNLLLVPSFELYKETNYEL